MMMPRTAQGLDRQQCEDGRDDEYFDPWWSSGERPYAVSERCIPGADKPSLWNVRPSETPAYLFTKRTLAPNCLREIGVTPEALYRELAKRRYI
jgi:hypothetical protein